MDRRLILAVVLAMAVVFLPTLFIKRPIPAGRRAGARADSVLLKPGAEPESVPRLSARDTAGPLPGRSVREDTIVVSSPLYRYAFSTRGGRLIQATLLKYRSMVPEDHGAPAQLFPPDGDFLSFALLVGRDTVSLRDWSFVPSDSRLEVTPGRTTTLTLRATNDPYLVEVEYGFVPEDYRVTVRGRVSGIGPNGAMLLVGMGPGLRNTESDSVEHSRELGVVTKETSSTLTRFMKLKPGQPVALGGPFEWVAVKSKYFVSALLAVDTNAQGRGGISGATALATDRLHKTPQQADVRASVPLPEVGTFGFMVYVGPMEYPRLRAIGHDFDDVNPYGWPGFRTIIRPVALAARSLLVWIHDGLGLAYGVGLILFGILIRVLLWPLNQKAMRASMAMQAIQPLMNELKEKYQSDPARLQQETFKLYREHGVNPFSGCWPLLLPWPILLALFFVFANTIELRGAAFLWLPDLSRPDPLYVIPVIMGLSMFGLTKIGQIGLPPNPQMKMMLYIMPVMMTVLFLNFASGLNLYYSVMNLASIPQQWLVAKERLRRNPIPVAIPARPAPRVSGKR